MTKDQDIIKKLKQELKDSKKVFNTFKSIDPNRLQDLSAYSIVANESAEEECTAITQLGDVHGDEIVLKSIVNGLNEYNPDICEDRTKKYFSRVIYMLNFYRRAGTNIDNLVLHLVGDFISGWIHEELIETNSMSPIKAVLFMEGLLIKGIKTLIEEGDLKKIVIPCSCGNHSRTTKKNHFKNTAATSYEWLMYNHLSDYFSRYKSKCEVQFILSESPYIYYSIYGKINKFSHGNHFNYQGGIGGLEVPLKKWIHRENNVMPFDMAWIGHWHTYLVSPQVRINGSVIGYNEMGRAFGFKPELPQMQFQLLDKKRGYTFNCPIILTDF